MDCIPASGLKVKRRTYRSPGETGLMWCYCPGQAHFPSSQYSAIQDRASESFYLVFDLHSAQAY